MSRSQLNTEIAALDLELAARRVQLFVSGRERVGHLRAVPPVRLLAGGAAAGLVSGLLVSNCGPRFQLFCANGIRLWRLTGLALPLLLREREAAPVESGL